MSHCCHDYCLFPNEIRNVIGKHGAVDSAIAAGAFASEERILRDPFHNPSNLVPETFSQSLFARLVPLRSSDEFLLGLFKEFDRHEEKRRSISANTCPADLDAVFS